MDVHIARDGVIIGEYDEEDLVPLAARGELQLTDHYWREGMEDWQPLPELIGSAAWEAPPPRASRAVLAGGTILALATIGVAAFYLIAPDRARPNSGLTKPRAVPSVEETSAAERELRDKAAADLRQRIERLPALATPPLNTFYYDVAVRMNRTYLARTPWTAEIRGGENLVDPATGQTLRRTEFILTADYTEGEWTYRSYRASATEMESFAITEIEHDEKTPAPPSLVGMLGLKTRTL